MTTDSNIKHGETGEIVAIVPTRVFFAGIKALDVCELVFDEDHLEQPIELTRGILLEISEKQQHFVPALSSMMIEEFDNAGYDAINALAKSKSKYPMRIYQYLAALRVEEQVDCYLEARAELLARAASKMESSPPQA